MDEEFLLNTGSSIDVDDESSDCAVDNLKHDGMRNIDARRKIERLMEMKTQNEFDESVWWYPES